MRLYIFLLLITACFSCGSDHSADAQKLIDSTVTAAVAIQKKKNAYSDSVYAVERAYFDSLNKKVGLSSDLRQWSEAVQENRKYVPKHPKWPQIIVTESTALDLRISYEPFEKGSETYVIWDARNYGKTIEFHTTHSKYNEEDDSVIWILEFRDKLKHLAKWTSRSLKEEEEVDHGFFIPYALYCKEIAKQDSIDHYKKWNKK